MEARSPEAAQLPATQKPQGGFPFLTAFDDSIIAWIFGFLVSFFFVYLI